jgi:hypothetical protein
VQPGGHQLLGEVEGIGAREHRKQPALVDAVVEEQLLLFGCDRLELASPAAYLIAIASATFGASFPAPPTHIAALDEGAQRGEEAPVGVLDRAIVRTVLVDLGEAVEQSHARHAHAVEPQPAVVHTVQAELEAVVLDVDARQGPAVLATDPTVSDASTTLNWEEPLLSAPSACHDPQIVVTMRPGWHALETRTTPTWRGRKCGPSPPRFPGMPRTACSAPVACVWLCSSASG